MMVANSFDLWQKDSFFSAAEEVQESADIMESTYRIWKREKKEELKPENLDELSRELQTALGTAKWQLEEFVRAVRLSRGHHCDDITASRHKQFVAAIESQISRIEAALREALSEEGKQPLQWVNLNKEERDDLAMFLSGTPKIPHTGKQDSAMLSPYMKSSLRKNHHKGKDADLNLNVTCSRDTWDEKGYNNVFTSKNSEFIIDAERKENPGMRDDIICPAERTGTRKTWSSPNFGALKIVIADEDEERSKLIPSIEATPKEKGSKPLFWKQWCGEHPRVKGEINVFNQLFGQVGGLQRQFHSPLRLQLSRSIQLTLAIMISIFLIVPFLFYSS